MTTVTHATAATGSDNPAYQVSKDEWNVAHTVTGGEFGAFFGAGSDGVLTLTQTDAAPAYATKAGSGATTTFTLIRDIYPTDFTLDDVNGNFLLAGGGYRVFVNGTFLIDAGITVHRNGNAAVSNTAGAALAGQTAGGSVGGSAGVVGAGSGTTPSNQNPSIATTSLSAVAHGGRGGNESGGGTGGGAGLGGNVQLPGSAGSPANLVQAIQPQRPDGTLYLGGGGGSGGDSPATSTSGGGGGSGGVLAIYAKTLLNSGLISATGGNGGDASGAGAGAGGGGGGGGGAIILIYVVSGSTVGSTSVAGGAGGALQGAGATGVAGSAGLVWAYPLA